MKKTEVTRELKRLLKETALKAKAVEISNPAMAHYFMAQCVGISHVADALELSIHSNDKQEFDHPDTLLPISPTPLNSTTL